MEDYIIYLQFLAEQNVNPNLLGELGEKLIDRFAKYIDKIARNLHQYLCDDVSNIIISFIPYSYQHP